MEDRNRFTVSNEKANRRKIGSQYETLAADYLTGKNAAILERNFRCRQGEIDLILRDGDYLVFAEVKYRKTASMGLPEEAVHERKQQRIRRAAEYYLYKHRYGEDTPCRFDVISILGSEVTWIKNAFF